MIKPRVLIFHGRDDAYVPAARVAAFKAGLDRTKADWMMTIYSGTRHSFADSGANARGIKNMIYNEKSARRSWTAMMTLFDEVFK